MRIQYSGTLPYHHPIQYDHPFITTTFLWPEQKLTDTFSYLKAPLIQAPRYYNQRPPFGVLSPYFLYKITLLI